MNLAPNDPPTSRRMELELHDEMCYVDGGKGQQHSRRVLGSSTMGIIETAETTSKSGLSSQSPLVKKGDALLSPSSTEIANPKKHDSHKVAVVKKAKKRTWKKPEGMPKRPLSAYNLFFQEKRRELLGDRSNMYAVSDQARRKHKKTHGKIGFQDMAKKIAVEWRKLSADKKRAYEEDAETRKESYVKAMREFRRKESLNASFRTEEVGEDSTVSRRGSLSPRSDSAQALASLHVSDRIDLPKVPRPQVESQFALGTINGVNPLQGESLGRPRLPIRASLAVEATRAALKASLSAQYQSLNYHPSAHSTQQLQMNPANSSLDVSTRLLQRPVNYSGQYMPSLLEQSNEILLKKRSNGNIIQPRQVGGLMVPQQQQLVLNSSLIQSLARPQFQPPDCGVRLLPTSTCEFPPRIGGAHTSSYLLPMGASLSLTPRAISVETVPMTGNHHHLMSYLAAMEQSEQQLDLMNRSVNARWQLNQARFSGYY